MMVKRKTNLDLPTKSISGHPHTVCCVSNAGPQHRTLVYWCLVAMLDQYQTRKNQLETAHKCKQSCLFKSSPKCLNFILICNCTPSEVF